MSNPAENRSEHIFVALKSLCEYHGITIRDGLLRQIAAKPDRTLPELTPMLPPSLASLAGEIWTIMANSAAGGEDDRGRSAPVTGRGPGGPQAEDPRTSAVKGSDSKPKDDSARNAPPASQGSDAVPPPATAASDPRVIADLSDPDLLREQVEDLLPRMDYSEDVEEHPATLNTRVTRTGTALRWRIPADTAPATIYRVVGTYESPASNPDTATTLALTRGNEATDIRAIEAALRFYQVWSYSGETPDDVAWCQPNLLAEVAVCASPTEVHAVDEGGRVILKWRLPQGATRASVYRMPKSRYAQIRPRDAAYQIQPNGEHLTGLQDLDVEPGTSYVYHVYTEVEMGPVVHHSQPVEQAVSTRARVLPVVDLECQTSGTNGGSTFDLVWSAPPAGEVHIYRSKEAPPSGVVDQISSEEQLPQDVFTSSGRLPHPDAADLDSRRRMPHVEWDDQWPRVYFTPVTFLDGRVAIGKTISQVRTQSVSDVHIHERLHEQIVTLRWPDSADEVQVFLTPPSDTSTPNLTHLQPTLVCKKGKYRKDGLIALTLFRDCTVHLVPVIFSQGEAIKGDPVAVSYRRPWQVNYTLQMRKKLLGDATGEVSIASSDLPHKTGFVLVHNATHLPLHADDGTKVMVTPVADDPIPASTVFSPPTMDAPLGTYKFSFAMSRKATGFVRVFAFQLPAEYFDMVAVLDPPIPHLRLS